MEKYPDFFNGYSFIPFVSLVINRENFIQWKVRERTIEDHELVLVTSGKGTLNIGQQKIECEKGTLLYLHENMWHSIIAHSDSPITFYAVHFSYARARHVPENWSYHQDINYYLKEKKLNEKIWSFKTQYEQLPFDHSYKVINFNRIKEIFIDLNKIYKEKKLGFELQLNALLLELIHRIFNETHFHPDNDINMKKLSRAIEYVEEHYRENLSLKQLVSYLDIREGHLIQLFKKNTGRTPICFINHVKIIQAKDLLANTNLKVREIAYKVGFNDEFYFSRVFKKIEGISPGYFRKQN